MKRFGEKLRTLRQRHGFTMRRLADMLGVRDSYISQMEAGDKIPNVAMLIKIADVFHVSLDQLARDEFDVDWYDFKTKTETEVQFRSPFLDYVLSIHYWISYWNKLALNLFGFLSKAHSCLTRITSSAPYE